jgi:hypothetical protein
MHEPTSKFGRLGIEVGAFGRWVRLGFGILLLAPVATQIASDIGGEGEPLSYYVRAAAYLVAISAAYVAVYRVLSPSVLSRTGPWINTVIFVGPAFAAVWWATIIEPATSVALPADFALAFGAYVGLSFLLQWRIGYGGCEVVSLPIALGAPRHATYCIPLVAADVIEKRIIDRVGAPTLGAGEV